MLQHLDQLGCPIDPSNAGACGVHVQMRLGVV